MRIERVVLIVVMTIIVGLGTWLLRESSTSLVIMASVFLASIGSFLGLDLVSMVKETRIAPPGDYEPMARWKYYFCLALSLALAGETVILQFFYMLELPVPLSMFIAGSAIVVGIMLNGFKANSIVTGKKKE